MKTKTIKAQKMWGGRNNLYSTYYAGEGIYGKITRAKYAVPADAASRELMIEQIANQLFETQKDKDMMHLHSMAGVIQCNYRKLAISALAAIGIKHVR